MAELPALIPFPVSILRTLVAAANGRAQLRLAEFIAATIRNPHTRRAERPAPATERRRAFRRHAVCGGPVMVPETGGNVRDRRSRCHAVHHPQRGALWRNQAYELAKFRSGISDLVDATARLKIG